MDDVSSALIHAVREGDLEETTALIDSYGLSYSADSSQGYDLLKIALENNNSAMAKLLITKGCSVRASSGPINSINTPLYFALRNDDLEIISLLLDEGARSIDTSVTDYLLLLHIALSSKTKTSACKRNFDEVASLLMKKLVDAITIDKHPLTPSNLATICESKDVVNLLLERGEQVNVQDEWGTTFLFHAVQKGDSTIVEAILKHDPDMSNRYNQLCLRTAVCRNGKDFDRIVLALLDYGFTVNPENAKDLQFLHAAVDKGIYGIVSDLLENGADPNADYARPSNFPLSQSDAYLPLHRAVKYRHGRVAELLIKHKADVNAPGKNKIPPIFFSVENLDLTMTQLLLNNGAALHYTLLPNSWDIMTYRYSPRDSRNEIWRRHGHYITINRQGVQFIAEINGGLTVLHISVLKGSQEMVALLLRYNADVNVTDGKGVTPLHISAELGDLEISTLLLDEGARVNAKEIDGNTPLHLAVKSGNVKVVKLLIERGAQVNSKGRGEKTPLHLSAERGHFLESSGNVEIVDTCVERENVEIIKALLEHGAEVNSRCRYGETALHFSSLHGAIKTTFALIEYGADINISCKNDETPLDCATLTFRYSSKTPGRHQSCRDTVHYLNRHHVKMEVAGLVAAGFWPSKSQREGGLEDFHFECQLELTRTKDEFFEDTNVSYYDILKKDSRCVAKYMKNPSVMLDAESEHYRNKFPLYASIIKSRFRKSLENFKLLESARQVVYCLSGLPDVCIEQILDRLSVDDLKALMEVSRNKKLRSIA